MIKYLMQTYKGLEHRITIFFILNTKLSLKLMPKNAYSAKYLILKYYSTKMYYRHVHRSIIEE